MKLPAKVIAAIFIVVALAGLGLWAQKASSAPRELKLTSHDMDVFFHEILSPQQQQQVASDPEGKKKLLEGLKNLFAVAQQAEMEGYDKTIEMELTLTEDDLLNKAYLQKHPDAKVSDEEVKAYYQNGSTAFDQYVKSNKQAQQLQGPELEDLKKAFAQFKITAEKARAEGLDKEDANRLRILYQRSITLFKAYADDLGKKVDKQIHKEDIEGYYRARQNEFDRVLVRRIQISPDQQELTAEQARQKAEEALARARKGEDFTKLVMEYSDEPAREDAGELGYIAPDAKMTPGFEKLKEVALSLRAGEIGPNVIETPAGLFIIKAEERQSVSPLDDEKTRQSIKEKLKSEKLQQRLDEIANTSRVEIAENFDTTPKPATQPAQSGQQDADEE